MVILRRLALPVCAMLVIVSTTLFLLPAPAIMLAKWMHWMAELFQAPAVSLAMIVVFLVLLSLWAASRRGNSRRHPSAFRSTPVQHGYPPAKPWWASQSQPDSSRSAPIQYAIRPNVSHPQWRDSAATRAKMAPKQREAASN
jgi:hypothetical protein